MDFTAAEQFLIDADPTLGRVIDFNDTLPPRPRHGNYEALARSIIGQQISVKAAANIFARFQEVTNLQPEMAVGITNHKASK